MFDLMYLIEKMERLWFRQFAGIARVSSICSVSASPSFFWAFSPFNLMAAATSQRGIFCFQGRERHLVFKSGWVGIATHKNIVDFFFYSYLWNPVFLKLVIVRQTNQLLEAFSAAFSYRGFQPIIVEDNIALKKLKRRKMAMQTVVAECFQEINGPLIIMAPGLHPSEHLKLRKEIGLDMHEIQRRFLRSGVVLCCQLEPQPEFSDRLEFRSELGSTIYTNQLILLADLLSKPKSHKLTITAYQMLNYKYSYTKQSYTEFIENQFLNKMGYTIVPTSMEEYISQLDKFEEQLSKKEKEQ